MSILHSKSVEDSPEDSPQSSTLHQRKPRFLQVVEPPADIVPERDATGFSAEELEEAEQRLEAMRDKCQQNYYEALTYRDILQPMYKWSVADAKYLASKRKEYDEIISSLKEMESQYKEAQEELQRFKEFPQHKHDMKISYVMEELRVAKDNLEKASFLERIKYRKLVAETEKKLLEVYAEKVEEPNKEELAEHEQTVEFFFRYISNLRGEYNALERERRVEAPLPVNRDISFVTRYGTTQKFEEGMDFEDLEGIHQSIRGEYTKISQALDSYKKELVDLENMTPELLIVKNQRDSLSSKGISESRSSRRTQE